MFSNHILFSCHYYLLVYRSRSGGNLPVNKIKLKYLTRIRVVGGYPSNGCADDLALRDSDGERLVGVKSWRVAVHWRHLYRDNTGARLYW